MGFFEKPDDPARVANAPLTRDRIESFLESQDWNFSVDSDGDVGGLWDDNIFYFFLMGKSSEVLQVRGRWKHRLPLETKGEVLSFIDGFHLDRIWPKAYTREEDGELSIYTEVSVDLEYGVADDQLGQLIACGLFTGLRFFDSLAEHLGMSDPEPEPAS